MIKEITIQEASNRKIDTSFGANTFWDVNVFHTNKEWTFTITERKLQDEFKKNIVETPYESYHGDARVFAFIKNGREAGYISIGYERWNKSAWLYFIGVSPEYRGCGIGTRLLQKAEEVARSFGARIMMLETQSNNTPAIYFYLARGFSLVGINTKTYTNRDIKNREVFFCMGKELT